MTKKDLVRQIAADLGISQVMAREIVQRTLDAIIQATIANGRIELRNFGVFEIKMRAARKARNPKTNEEVLVPAKHVLGFQPGKNVAKMIRDARRPDIPPAQA